MKKYWGINLIIVLLVCSFAFSGCRFFYSTKLQAPKLSHNKSDMTIYWDANFNASDYEVYMNSNKISTISSGVDRTQYEYCYEDVIGDFGEFHFQVKSIGAGKYADSELSEAVIVKVGSAISYLDKNIPDIEYDYNSGYAPTNVQIEGNIVTWHEPSLTANVDGYLVSVYTNTLGLKHYELDSTSLELSNSMKSGNEILAIKVSSVVDKSSDVCYYEAGDVYYYNPLDYGVFTDTIYIFDGGVYDYYIENYTELQNLYYYAFINRIENLKFKVSDIFYDANENTYFDTLTGKADQYIYNMYYDEYYGEWYLYDTIAYYETSGKFNLWPTLTMGSGTNEFVLKCEFAYSGDPTNNGTRYYKQDKNFSPYYDTVNYEKRSEDYNDFASENWFLSTQVNSSEELFWAVSNHVAPEFSDTTSNEYIIYNNAKKVLRNIISDEMTDYEKVLSIFDYIMLNTTYDYNSLLEGESLNAFEQKCYYLESVLLDINSEDRFAVCDGYSKTFALLCNMEGINCVRIVGNAGGGHAWNKVELNGNWYVVDITWTEIYDDTDGYELELGKYSNGDDYLSKFVEDEEECSHSYFLVSDDDISTHTDFNNRYIYSLLDAPNSYNYYIEDKIGGQYSRVITSTDQLKEILNYAIKTDNIGVEIVITGELYSQYDGDITEILKQSKPINFVAMEQCIERGKGGLSTYVSYTFDGKTYYDIDVYSGVYVAGIYYDAENPTKQGILMSLKPSVSISSTARLNEYINFVKTNKIDYQSKVGLENSMIESWIGSLDGLSQEEKIQLIENYFATVLGTVEIESKTYSVSTEIEQTEADETSTLLSQNDDGTWEEKTITSGVYSFDFIYSET